MSATRSFGLVLLGLGFTLGFRSAEAPESRAPSPCQAERFAADPPLFGNCSVCHADAAADTGDGFFRLSGVPDIWSTGTTYRLAAELADPGQRLWGFRATAIDASGGDAGILQPADAATAICILDANHRTYIRSVERFPGVPGGQVRWEFDWTPPQSGTRRVFFYGAALAADQDGTDRGDFTYTAATASVEAGAGPPPVSLILQPDGVSVAGGSSLVIHARVKNHSGASRAVTYTGRIGGP
ncbi:MAG: choice-of-anchor V domain-containing protein, partial [Planctomycetota bacterium]